MNKKRFNIRKSHVIKNGWFIEDSLKKFTFPTSKGDKGWLTSYCKALNKLFEDKKQLKKLLECSREEANDYCEELMEKDEFIRLYKRIGDELKEENEQLKQSINEVVELLSEEVDLFSEKATEHDMNAYVELQELDNKDAYYMATATKKAIKMLKELKE